MKRLAFAATARAELRKARSWYHDQRSGLENELSTEMERVLDSILENPRAFPVVHRGIRRALTNRFPYKVFFIERGDTVVVLAVRHQSQRPLRRLEGR